MMGRIFMLLSYLYLIPKTSNLRVLIGRLADLSIEINSDLKNNKSRFWSYPRFCLVVGVFIMLYGTAENFMYHVQGLKGLMNHTGLIKKLNFRYKVLQLQKLFLNGFQIVLQLIPKSLSYFTTTGLLFLVTTYLHIIQLLQYYFLRHVICMDYYRGFTWMF